MTVRRNASGLCYRSRPKQHQVGLRPWITTSPQHSRVSPPSSRTRTSRAGQGAHQGPAARCAGVRPRGLQGEDTPKVMRFAAALGHSQESSIIGGGSLSLTGATLFNGFLITAVSMCDVYRPTATHFQPVIVPPALAIAERDEASGRDLLVALVAGFETAARIAAGVDYPAFRKRGWHGPGTIGPFGAAAAVGRLLDFDPDNDGHGFRSRRQPGGRYLCRVGNAVGQVPPVSRRSIGSDGGAARRAGIRCDSPVPDSGGRRLLSDLLWRQSRRMRRRQLLASTGSWSRSRCGLRPLPLPVRAS